MYQEMLPCITRSSELFPGYFSMTAACWRPWVEEVVREDDGPESNVFMLSKERTPVLLHTHTYTHTPLAPGQKCFPTNNNAPLPTVSPTGPILQGTRWNHHQKRPMNMWALHIRPCLSNKYLPPTKVSLCCYHVVSERKAYMNKTCRCPAETLVGDGERDNHQASCRLISSCQVLLYLVKGTLSLKAKCW